MTRCHLPNAAVRRGTVASRASSASVSSPSGKVKVSSSRRLDINPNRMLYRPVSARERVVEHAGAA